MEDILNVMMEERRKMSEMKIACIEKGRLAGHEHEMVRIQLKDKKTWNGKNENGTRYKKIERGIWNGKIENGKAEGRKRAYDNGCKYVVFSAARIYSSMPNGNPWKTKVLFLDYYHHQCSYFVYD